MCVCVKKCGAGLDEGGVFGGGATAEWVGMVEEEGTSKLSCHAFAGVSWQWNSTPRAWEKGAGGSVRGMEVAISNQDQVKGNGNRVNYAGGLGIK